MDRMNVVISTDGACSGNPGPGGCAARMVFDKHWYEIADYSDRTTNNRMEMTAAIKAIEKLKKPCFIIIRTDSQVLINAIARLEDRAKNGWKNRTGAKVANCDLHKALYELKHNGNHEICYQYVEGHSGDPDNERCDFLAKQAITLKKGYEARG